MANRLILCIIILVSVSCGKAKIEGDIMQIASPTNLKLNKVIFLNQQIGFAVGGERFDEACLLKTMDGGDTWFRIDLSFAPEKKAIYGMDISPSGKIITAGYGGTIFVSQDTGKTFQYIQHNSWREFQDVEFKSDDSCVIVGGISFDKGFVATMEAEGKGDKQVKEEWKAEMCDIDMLDDQHGYMAGFGAILKTTNGGLTWEFTTAENDFFKAISWKNKEEGITVGYAGSIYKTINGGATWKTIRNGNSLTKKKLNFLNCDFNGLETYIAVGEQGCVCISKDNGETWNQVKKFTAEDIRGVAFSTSTTCFLVGTNGAMFKLKV